MKEFRPNDCLWKFTSRWHRVMLIQTCAATCSNAAQWIDCSSANESADVHRLLVLSSELRRTGTILRISGPWHCYRIDNSDNHEWKLTSQLKGLWREAIAHNNYPWIISFMEANVQWISVLTVLRVNSRPLESIIHFVFCYILHQ